MAGDGIEELHVYWCRPASERLGMGLLDEAETQALARLRLPRDRDRYVTAHASMRRVLAEHTGIAPADQRFFRRCLVCGGEHGKPRLLPAGVRPGDVASEDTLHTPQISLSHVGNRILVAIRAGGAVGVDVEHWDLTDFPGFQSVALTPDEARELLEFDLDHRIAARTTWWVRKEAVLKVTGHGLRVDATRLRVSAPDRAPRLLDWTDQDVPRPEITMADLPVPGRYSAAVAVAGHVRMRVFLDELSPGARS